jgi:hypothetical protein
MIIILYYKYTYKEILGIGRVAKNRRMLWVVVKDLVDLANHLDHFPERSGELILSQLEDSKNVGMVYDPRADYSGGLNMEVYEEFFGTEVLYRMALILTDNSPARIIRLLADRVGINPLRRSNDIIQFGAKREQIQKIFQELREHYPDYVVYSQVLGEG